MSIKLTLCETYGSNSKENLCIIDDDGKFHIKSTTNKSSSVKKGLFDIFKSVFLPQGYPECVSSDYLEYQLWDTMQAFCSSITGTLATRAVLKGYGVGDESATVAAATLTWMLKDGAGMIGRIFFAWLKGLFADILNDVAILMDLIAPMFKPFFVYITCFSSIARSVVGVAGGATRAALTLHQARRDNMADVSAKDGSQETLVNLMALIAGFIITPFVTDNQPLVWFLFFIFTYLHLFANYRAVSTVVMETINLPRLHILMKRFLNDGVILRPVDVALVDPVIRSPGYKSKIYASTALHEVLKSPHKHDLSSSDFPVYVIGYNSNSINIALHQDATNYDIRKSAFHGLMLDLALHKDANIEMISKKYQLNLSKGISSYNTSTGDQNLILYTQEIVDEIYPCFERELEDKHWDLTRCHLGLDEWRYTVEKKNL